MQALVTARAEVVQWEGFRQEYVGLDATLEQLPTKTHHPAMVRDALIFSRIYSFAIFCSNN